MEKIDKLFKIMLEIELELRFLKGLNENKVDKMKSILLELIDEYNDKEYIPKKLCYIFIDFYPALQAMSDLYKDEEKEKIIYFIDDIIGLMLCCTYIELDEI